MVKTKQGQLLVRVRSKIDNEPSFLVTQAEADELDVRLWRIEGHDIIHPQPVTLQGDYKTVDGRGDIPHDY